MTTLILNPVRNHRPSPNGQMVIGHLQLSSQLIREGILWLVWNKQFNKFYRIRLTALANVTAFVWSKLGSRAVFLKSKNWRKNCESLSIYATVLCYHVRQYFWPGFKLFLFVCLKIIFKIFNPIPKRLIKQL